MYTVDLQQIVKDFAELPSEREALLEAVPQYIERHFKAVGIVSVLFDGKLRVLRSSDSAVEPGAEPPACEQFQEALSAGEQGFQAESHELPDTPYISGNIIRENILPVAVVQLHRAEPFQANTIGMLELFSELLSSKLSLLSSSTQAGALAELATTLSAADSVTEGARLALEIIARFTNAEAGVIVQAERGVMKTLARFGYEPAPDRAVALGIGQPYPAGLAWRACITGEVQNLAVDDGTDEPLAVELTVVQPLGWRGTYRYALVLRLKPRLLITPADQGLFEAMSTQLHLALDRLQTDVVQDRLLSLQEAVVDSDARDLFQRIMQDAVDLVPGAQSGSLLMRNSPEQPFQYRAAIGYDLEGLRNVEFDVDNMLKWYGRSVEEWEQGEPRVLRESAALSIRDRSYHAIREREFVSGTERIKSNICMPVAFRGDVLAFINLDNHYDNDAFGDDSYRVFRLFAPVVSSMLVVARQRDRIFDLAHTDQLTHLPNRRGWDLALAGLLKRSEELTEPFVLLVADLRNFKAVNDSFGHDEGDRALQLVARTLVESARIGDTVSRWGGDEFAVLLPRTDAATGEQVAERLRAAIRQLRMGDVKLGIDIGVAAYPDDATSAEQLLQLGDERMYQQKRQRN